MLKKVLSSTVLTLLVVLFAIRAWAVDINLGPFLTGNSNTTPTTVVVSPQALNGIAESFQAIRKATESVVKTMQGDKDGDGIINGFDSDIDGDGIRNEVDGCPFDSQNRCSNKVGGKNSGDDDLVAEDADYDGIPDVDDNCMDVPNEDQTDEDEDGVGDLCDADYNPSAGLPEGFDEGGACSLSPAGGLNCSLLALMLSVVALAIRRRK